MSSTRTHVAKCSTLTIRLEEMTQRQALAWEKPQGFWYEVDGGWRDWCRGEEPGWICGRSLYAVKLDPALNLIQIASSEEFERFWPTIPSGSFVGPNWKKLAEKYDGIEIAPYLWDFRLSCFWYYGWDCASGCLWRPRETRVAFVRKLTELDLASTPQTP